MPNTFFRFKEFTVNQAQSAMKVSTDGCLFGAWIRLPAGARTTLDVGCGTGLLSLMTAQRHPDVHFTGIEIDEAAAGEAADNAGQSPFADRIDIVPTDARHWIPPQRFDAIICNPPFFRGSLLGPDAARNTARHADSFSSADFTALLGRVAADGAAVYLLLPATEAGHWTNAVAQAGWHCVESLYFRTRQKGEPTGVMLRFSQSMQPEQRATIDVYAAGGGYSPAAIAMLSPYYLYL